MADYSLGIDTGTSSIKVGLLNLSTLKLEDCIEKNYENSSEQRSVIIWNQTLEAIKESVSRLKDINDIKAIGLSGQMHGTVLYDKNGIVIDPIINWRDDRCNKPLEKYGNRTTIDVIEKILGTVGFEDLGIDKMASGFMGATLFYIKENDKSLFNKIKHAVLPVDFIRGKLLGKNDYSTDQTNAFSTGLFNTRSGSWHKEFIKKLGLPIDIFPEVHHTPDIAGYVSREIANLLGFKNEIPVIYGGGDNQMSILGSGLFSSGSPALINIGTGAQISKIISKYKKIPGIDTRSFFSGMYAFVGASLGGGINYKWLKDELNLFKSKDIDFKQMDKFASRIAPGSDGLKFCTGPSRSDPNRKIGFYGNMEYKNSEGHKARAVMEGVLLDLLEFYQLFGKDHSSSIVGSGNGLLKGKIWSQIAADMFGKIVKITDFENAVFGAALMAALGINKIMEFEKINNLITYKEIVPNTGNHRKYIELLENGY